MKLREGERGGRKKFFSENCDTTTAGCAIKTEEVVSVRGNWKRVNPMGFAEEHDRLATQTWEEGEGGVRGRALEVDEPPGRR